MVNKTGRVLYSSSYVGFSNGFVVAIPLNSRSWADRPYVPPPFVVADDGVLADAVGSNVDGGVIPLGFDVRSMRGGRSGAVPYSC